MNEKDETILEYLDRIHPSAESPATIHWNIQDLGLGDWVVRTTRRRIQRLQEAGYVELVSKESLGLRRITEDGRKFLRGEDDASEREVSGFDTDGSDDSDE